MHVRFADLDRKRAYKLIAGAIIPRPIALVTTRSGDGIVNAAPFSAFNYMSEDPPLVALGLQVHPDGGPRAGELKDTTSNLLATGEFVVNLVDAAMLEKLVDCAVDFPPETSEPERLGLALAPAITIGVPRLRDAPIALECRRVVALNFSSFRTVLIGEIIAGYFRDGVMDPESFNFDLAAYQPVGRLFGSLYCRVQDVVSLPTRTFARWCADQDAAAEPPP